MTVKHYNPTQEQRDRWRVAMRNWQDVECVNKAYYDGIHAHMQTLEKPTVLDALKEMYRKGNEPYFKEYKTYLKQSRIEAPFTAKITERRITQHEVFHFWARLGHTPEQEQWVIPLELARHFVGGTVTQADGLRESLDHRANEYFSHDCHYHHQPHRILPANDRQSAIYFAQAVYLLQKVKNFYRQGAGNTSYEQQRVFAKNYGDSDDKVACSAYGEYDVKATMPYEMIVMSPKEQQAITAVATGLLEPEQTPYPHRMAMLKQVLLEAEMLYDMKPWAARASKNHRNLDPEQFKAAREKRGTSTRD